MIHAEPINDLIEHIESMDCPCNPTANVVEGIIFHHAMDRRECFEPDCPEELK